MLAREPMVYTAVWRCTPWQKWKLVAGTVPTGDKDRGCGRTPSLHPWMYVQGCVGRGTAVDRLVYGNRDTPTWARREEQYLFRSPRVNTDEDFVAVGIEVVADAALGLPSLRPRGIDAFWGIAAAVVAHYHQVRRGPVRTRLGEVTDLVPPLPSSRVEHVYLPVVAAALLDQSRELQGQDLPEFQRKRPERIDAPHDNHHERM